MRSARLILFALSLVGLAGAQVQWHTPKLPSPRMGAAMVMDSVNERMVMFGGRNGGAYLNDAWELPLGDPSRFCWLPLSLGDPEPSGRYWSGGVCDQLHRKMYLISGRDESGIANDVWVMDLSLVNESWQQLSPIGAPDPPRFAPYAIYHPSRNSVICFAGSQLGQWFNDVWELKLDSMVWRQMTLADPKPEIRGGGGQFYDERNDRMIIFGGARPDHCYNDLWALTLTPGNEHWTELQPTGTIPSRRNCFNYGFDARRRLFYVFGGGDDNGVVDSSAFVLDLDSLRWTQLDPVGDIPSARGNSACAYDPFGDDFLFFGGFAHSTGYYGDLWFLPSVAGTGIGGWNSPSSIAARPALYVPSIASGPVRIRYALAAAGRIDVRVLDVSGRVVRNLFSGKTGADQGWLTWDCADDDGRPSPAGTYYCVLTTEGAELTGRKVALVR